MMHDDPIVKEVRRVREALAAQFEFDLRGLYRALKRKEQQSGREVVAFGPKPAASIEIAESEAISAEKEAVK